MDKERYQGEVGLRPAGPEDIPTIEGWLHKDYIRRWYGDPEDWLAEIRNDGGNYGWLHHYIVMYGTESIGFCQYYDCAKTQDGYVWEREPRGTFAIDYLIGEEAYLKKGLGSVIIQQLCRHIRTRENPVQFVADPVPENLNSIRLLVKNGFVLDQETGLYKLKIKTAPV